MQIFEGQRQRPIPARADDQMAQRSERFRLYRLRARQRTWTAEVLNAQDIKQQVD